MGEKLEWDFGLVLPPLLLYPLDRNNSAHVSRSVSIFVSVYIHLENAHRIINIYFQKKLIFFFEVICRIELIASQLNSMLYIFAILHKYLWLCVVA